MIAPPAFSAGGRCAVRIDGYRGLDALRQPFHDRQYAALLLSLVYRLRARPRRFAADIQHVGSFLHHPDAGFNGPRGIEQAAAIGKGIGCDVDDAHHERAIAGSQALAMGERNGVPAAKQRGTVQVQTSKCKVQSK